MGKDDLHGLRNGKGSHHRWGGLFLSFSCQTRLLLLPNSTGLVDVQNMGAKCYVSAYLPGGQANHDMFRNVRKTKCYILCELHSVVLRSVTWTCTVFLLSFCRGLILSLSRSFCSGLLERLPNGNSIRSSKRSGTEACKAQAVPGVRRLCSSRRPERSFVTKNRMLRGHECKGK